MAGRNRPMDEYTIIADLMRQAKRHGSALNVQLPVPKKDTFTVASTPSTTYTLSFLPISPSINLSLNGLELLEGTDYTVDYTTAIVTVSATLKGTPTPADVLTADYWTTGDLIAATAVADTGLITDNFNRANSTTSLGTTSDGKATWVAGNGVWGIDTNQAYQTTFDNTHKFAYVETGASDGTLQVSVPTPGGQNGAGLLLRYVDNNNWYAVRIKSGVLLSTMISKVAGVENSLASFTFTVTNPLKVTMTGSMIQVYDGATSALLATDTSGNFTTATKHGLYITQNDLAPRLDDWSFSG